MSFFAQNFKKYNHKINKNFKLIWIFMFKTMLVIKYYTNWKLIDSFKILMIMINLRIK